MSQFPGFSTGNILSSDTEIEMEDMLGEKKKKPSMVHVHGVRNVIRVGQEDKFLERVGGVHVYMAVGYMLKDGNREKKN